MKYLLICSLIISCSIYPALNPAQSPPSPITKEQIIAYNEAMGIITRVLHGYQNKTNPPTKITTAQGVELLTTITTIGIQATSNPRTAPWFLQYLFNQIPSSVKVVNLVSYLGDNPPEEYDSTHDSFHRTVQSVTRGLQKIRATLIRPLIHVNKMDPQLTKNCCTFLGQISACLAHFRHSNLAIDPRPAYHEISRTQWYLSPPPEDVAELLGNLQIQPS